jgi:hypothetical protein
MPGPAHCRGQNLVDAVREGHIPESKIDILALHVLELAAKVGMDD